MKRTNREIRKLNNILRELSRFEEQFPDRGFQLSIEFIIAEFNIKYDEFPIMRQLVIDPKATTKLSLVPNEYMKFRWMKGD